MNESASRAFRAEVLENIPLGSSCFLLTVKSLSETLPPDAGQFYMISTTKTKDPLLRRPFGAFGWKDGAIEILYRLRGKGTMLMATIKPGYVIDFLGPLGNAYPAPLEGQTPVVVAGGVGMASLYPLAYKYRKSAIVLYGGRNADELPVLSRISPEFDNLFVSTEDGSIGYKGIVTGLFDKIPHKKAVIYTCGPMGLIGAVASYAAQKGIEGYASLEERMACGVGACLGCAVKTKNGYRRVCKEGPVFKLRDIPL